jgi:hypothetical protein
MTSWPRISKLHDQMLKSQYFPVVGGMFRFTGCKNRRKLDMNVTRFEQDTSKDVSRLGWGLPEPNLEASYLSLAKYAKPIPYLSATQATAMNIAFSWTERHFGPYMAGARIKTLSEVVDGLDKTTSPGVPWTKKYATKRAMIDQWKDFEQYMEDDWARLQDENYTAIFGNSLKEEIRLVEKIKQNSLRTFTAGPIEMTIHGNRLFEDMNERFYASHIKTASVVGFSPLKGGWNELYLKLKRFNNGFALDESQYDSSLRAYMMWGCALLRWRMLRPEDQTPENLTKLKVYYRNLVNTVIITAEGVFVMKQGGNPSGSVNTISDNTLILFTLIAYAWIMLSPESLRTYEAFDDNLALALCGDDNTWTASDEAVQFFNATTLIEQWKNIGITTTTDSMLPRPVEDLDFLSAHTAFIEGKAVPLYDREKLLTSLLYSRFPEDPAYTLTRAAAILQIAWVDENMRSYLREFIHWLLEQYDNVLKDDLDWRRAKANIPTEGELRKLFLGDTLLVPQSRRLERLSSEINNCETMSTVQNNNKKTRRSRKRARGPKIGKRTQRRAGPAMKSGAFFSRNQQRLNSRPQRKQLTGKGSVRNATTNRRSMMLEEDEYIGEITTSGTPANFNVVSYPVNIGQKATFPWGSGVVSKSFEKYQFDRIEFYVKREVSEFATAGTTGKVMMSFDSDASDPPPATKQQIEDTDPHVDGMPSENIRLAIPPQMLKRLIDGFYIRPAGLPGSADIKTYDLGNLFVATQGIAGTGAQTVGELHVRYRCRVFIPILENLAGAPANNSVALFQTPTASPETFTSAAGYQYLMSQAVTNGLGAVNTAGSIVLPPGNYLLDLTGQAGATTLQTTLVIQKNGVSILATGIEDAGTAISNCSNSASTFVSCNGSDAITVNATTNYGYTGTLVTWATLRIHSV